jgi:Cytochrome P460
MKGKGILTIAIATAVVAVLGGRAMSAQDKYAVKVPDGLVFADFKGYENWQVIAASHAGNLMSVIVGNPAMIEAYRGGAPGNGKPFPDGARMVKIHWNTKKSADAPEATIVPDTLHDVDLMERSSKKFADSGNWGYTQLNYDAASDKFTPLGPGHNCGFGCHTIVASKDYVFTAYPRR